MKFIGAVLLPIIANLPGFFSQDDISSNCTIARETFANASSVFTKCAIEYSRPITFCEKCINEYINVLNSYKNISKALNNGTSCMNSFLNLDRLGIIATLYNDNKDLWTRAKCYECFVIDNGQQTANFSIITTTFKKYHGDYTDCVKHNEHDEVCNNCLTLYQQLESYFLSISNENEKIGVCMDIVDAMNSTWNYWGNTCCKFRKHNEYLFITSAVSTLLLTVLFYVLTQFWAKKKLPTIIEQTRFLNTLES